MATFCESPPKPCSQVRPSPSRGRLNSIRGSPSEMSWGEVDMAPLVSHGEGPHSTLLQEDDMADTQAPGGPDLAQGVPLSDLPDGHMLAGHVGEHQVLLARVGQDVF